MIRIRACACLAVIAAGCLSSGTVPCDDGRLCPAGTVCDDVHARCLLPSQAGCAPEGGDCTITSPGDGVCVDGWCLRKGCGDTRLDPGEQCDGTTFAPGASCTSIGYYHDVELRCTDRCTIDPAGCAGTCGDGVLEKPEECEDGIAIPATTTCRSLGYYDDGPVTCDARRCTFVRTSCTGYCGDGTRNGPELCDGAWESPLECADFGFDAGAVSCVQSLCAAGFDGCAFIGWNRVPGAPAGGFSGITGTGPDDVWMVGGRTAYRWDGHTWTSFDPDTAGAVMVAAWSSSATDLWIVGTHGLILHWDGATWTSEHNPVPLYDLMAVHGTGPDDVWAVGAHGIALHRDASGWTSVDGFGATPLTSVWDRDGHVWIVGAGGAVFEDGALVDVGTTEPLAAVWSSSPRDVWIAEGTGGVLHHWDGNRWTSVDDGLDAHSGLWGSGPRDVFAISQTGVYAHYDGEHWYATKVPALEKPNAIWGSGDGDVWAAGGSAIRYQGRGWVSDTRTLDVQSIGLAGTDAQVLFQSTNGNQLQFFDGSSWLVIGTSSFTHGWVASATDAVFADQFAIEQWDGQGLTVTPVLNGVSAVWGSGPDDVWVIGNDWAHWDGQSWILIAGPTISVTDAWGSGPDDIWAVALAGMIAHKDANGWTVVSSPTSRALYGVWGSGPTDVWAVGEQGTILHYDGNAWTVKQAPAVAETLTAIAGTAPDDVWAVSDFGSTYHYDGATWAPVRYTLAPGPEVYTSIFASGRHVFIGGSTQALQMDRTVPWKCRASERACGDGVDDDCDGAIDGADADCADLVRLTQVAGAPEPLLEVENRSSETVNLAGMTVAYHLGCDQFAGSYRFPADALVGPGQRFRAVAGTDLRARERVWSGKKCKLDQHLDSWFALCAGPCDLDTCAGVVDFVSIGTGGTSPPTCASFVPAPVDTSAILPGEGVARALFSSGGAAGAATDWAIMPVTRN